MATWYLNAFLTSFRVALNRTYPKRKKDSDGSIGDAAHSARISEHNPDKDGSVDAIDVDVNLLGSSDPTGTAAETAEVKKVLAEFQKQPQAQLWIYNRQIANRDIDNWRVRYYGGASPHDHHFHLQSRQSREGQKYTGEYVTSGTPPTPATPTTPPFGKAPAWPVALDKSFGYVSGNPPYIKTVYRAQAQLRARGWKIAVDGKFGAESKRILTAFQKEKGLVQDGLLGPKTWKALWEAPL